MRDSSALKMGKWPDKLPNQRGNRDVSPGLLRFIAESVDRNQKNWVVQSILNTFPNILQLNVTSSRPC